MFRESEELITDLSFTLALCDLEGDLSVKAILRFIMAVENLTAW